MIENNNKNLLTSFIMKILKLLLFFFENVNVRITLKLLLYE